MAVRSPQSYAGSYVRKIGLTRSSRLIALEIDIQPDTAARKWSVIEPIYIVLIREEGCSDCSETNWWDRTWL